MKTTIKNYFFYLLIVFFIAMFFIYPTNISSAVSSALNLCATIVIPSLFPFFVLSMLFIKSGLCEKIGNFLSPVLTPLFNLNSACCVAFILSLISGYPAGGIGAITLYKQNSCTKQQCERLLAFCNNCGPAFIITAIGSIMLNNYYAGIMLYVIHILCAAIIGIVSGRFFKKTTDKNKVKLQTNEIKIIDIFISSIKNSLAIMLEVCAIIVTFCALISLISSSGILNTIYTSLYNAFNIPLSVSNAIITGLLELTNGARLITLCNVNPVSMLVILSILIGFGGFCVHIQLLSHIKDAGLNAASYFFGKIAHGFLSGIMTYAVSKFIYKTSDVFSLKTTLNYSFIWLFVSSILMFLGMVIIMILVSFLLYKKTRQNI